jgi:hypothetical protein
MPMRSAPCSLRRDLRDGPLLPSLDVRS